MIVGNKGLGDTAQQAAGVATSIAAPIITGALAPATSFALGVGLSTAIPIVGAAVAGVTMLIGLWINKNAKYHAQEAATTKIVNEAEPWLQQNVAAFQDAVNKGTATEADRAQAIDNFNNVWNQVVQACGNPSFDDPGKRCVSDRSRGGKWDWFSYYYDPIVNATLPTQVANPVGSAFSSVENTLSNALGSGVSPMLLVAGLGIIGILLLNEAS